MRTGSRVPSLAGSKWLIRAEGTADSSGIHVESGIIINIAVRLAPFGNSLFFD